MSDHNTEQKLNAATKLIEYIECKPILYKEKRASMEKQNQEKMFEEMLQGKTSGEATGFRGVAFNTNDQEKAQQQIKEVEHDIFKQIEIVRDGVDFYYEGGWYPAPRYAWRIAVLLRKEKAYDLELRFLEAWNARWPDGVGKRYKMLKDREEKARTLAMKSVDVRSSANE